ncbi:hypothetical protein NDU88_007276 [Pleurodeles waltl]|uniref:Uncharacterized protein n=1 Tax=Pleurodeles waltl TaxID=8319 RepID=A0AAV7WH70_PLEWA|nr:hypothetical protein NDU88_007276 [Pleurodeles waltl]
MLENQDRGEKPPSAEEREPVTERSREDCIGPDDKRPPLEHCLKSSMPRAGVHTVTLEGHENPPRQLLVGLFKRWLAGAQGRGVLSHLQQWKTQNRELLVEGTLHRALDHVTPAVIMFYVYVRHILGGDKDSKTAVTHRESTVQEVPGYKGRK